MFYYAEEDHFHIVNLQSNGDIFINSLLYIYLIDYILLRISTHENFNVPLI
jgi:hypothetical protein